MNGVFFHLNVASKRIGWNIHVDLAKTMTFFFFFKRPHPGHMGDPGPGTKYEQQL